MAANQIFLCGDPHGQFDHIIDAVLKWRPAAVILLGDNTSANPLDIELTRILSVAEVWWIPGNHDTDQEEYYDNLHGAGLADRNLHGRVEQIAGYKVAGLGGVFRPKIWDETAKASASPETYLKTLNKSERWRGGLPLRHRSSIFRAEVAALSKRRADILVTHEAPHLHPQGSAVLTKLASDMRVKNAFHGHHHQDLKYSGKTWLGVGLRGIVTNDGQVIREGEKRSELYIGNVHL